MLTATANYMQDLETAYQIGKYIHSFVKDELDTSTQPSSDYRDYFKSGINPYWYQTKKGLILEVNSKKAPKKIHTPLGHWSILGNCCGNWNEVFNNLKETLGLEQLANNNSLWRITKWKDKKIEKAEYKEKKDYIPHKAVKKVWQSFATHSDLDAF